MQLLLLCKQKYMRKDVIHDRYGRLHELPVQLSRHHRLTAIATDYRATMAFKRPQCFKENGDQLTWYSIRVHWLFLPTLVWYWRLILREFRDNPPAVVIGASDSPHIILASMIARLYGVPVILDLYDNFEVFGLSRIPGVRACYRVALRRADAVTCVSSRLRDHVLSSYGTTGRVVTIESTINASDFHPVDRKAARLGLGLDPDGIYIGAGGALRASKGIDTVYEAFRRVVAARPEVKLLLAGETDPRATPPEHCNVINLGELPHADMNNFYNSLNVAFNYMQDDDFGRYSFPQKAYEMLACRVPVLSARVGVFADLLQQDRFLYTPGDPGELKNKIIALLDRPAVPELNIPTWEDQAGRMDELIRSLRGMNDA
jgi:glycosyltransferase involved in cell wall biosynthesis